MNNLINMDARWPPHPSTVILAGPTGDFSYPRVVEKGAKGGIRMI